MRVSRRPNEMAELAGFTAAARSYKRKRTVADLRWRYFCRAHPKEVASGYRMRALNGKRDNDWESSSMFACYRYQPHKHPKNIKARERLDAELYEAGLGDLVERRKREGG